jgi:double-stranded uracil-DNA glycosylase
MAMEVIRAKLLPDYLAPDLDVIVVGAAPSFAAASSGHYYAGGRNRFWLLLHQSGFTPRTLDPEEDSTILDYGLGLTAILPGHISTDNSRLPPPSDHERTELLEKLRRRRPRYICYNGRDVFRMVFGEEPDGWGLQREQLGESRQYVVHSSSGRADRWGADRLFLWRELKRLVDER